MAPFLKKRKKNKMSCTCKLCGNIYKVDIIIPDHIWIEINGHSGCGLICGNCIMAFLESNGYGAFVLEPTTHWQLPSKTSMRKNLIKMSIGDSVVSDKSEHSWRTSAARCNCGVSIKKLTDNKIRVTKIKKRKYIKYITNN